MLGQVRYKFRRVFPLSLTPFDAQRQRSHPEQFPPLLQGLRVSLIRGFRISLLLIRSSWCNRDTVVSSRHTCRCCFAAGHHGYCIQSTSPPPCIVYHALVRSDCQYEKLYRYGLGNVRTAVEYYKRAFDIDDTYKAALCSILQVRS